AAFAWVVEHIAEFGGDPSRIYVAGHSAGGHLAGVLSLDERALKVHKLTPKAIRGTIAMSGVFDLLAIGDSQASVFGTNKDVRRDASPLYSIKAAGETPPFI